MSSSESARKGRTITLYITDQEWELLKAKIQEQGQEGTDQQVTLFAKQWAKAGIRIPIRDELEQVLFKFPRSDASPS